MNIKSRCFSEKMVETKVGAKSRGLDSSAGHKRSSTWIFLLIWNCFEADVSVLLCVSSRRLCTWVVVDFPSSRPRRSLGLNHTAGSALPLQLWETWTWTDTTVRHTHIHHQPNNPPTDTHTPTFASCRLVSSRCGRLCSVRRPRSQRLSLHL